ncbi:MAG TPA: extracellular solute-binding protein, partial [Limnochordia bacterium]
MRRIGGILSLLTMCVVAGAGSAAAAQIQLVATHWGDNAGIEATWQGFSEANDRIDVTFRPIAWEEYVDKLTVEIAAGAGPDLLTLMGWETADMNFRSWLRDGFLLDLTPYWRRDRAELQADEWFPFIIPMASYQGRLAGLPYGWSVFNAVTYNADLFDQAGVAYPDDTWTWDTLREMSRKFVRLAGDGSVIQRGLAPGDLAWWTVETMVHSRGGTVFNPAETGLALSNAATMDAMASALRFVQERAAVPGLDWVQGNVALRMAAIHWATVDKTQAKFPAREGIAVTPMDSVTGQRRGNLVEIMLTGVNRNTKNPEAAWEAMKWFTLHYAEAAQEAWGVIQFVPVSPRGLQAFLRQPADAVNTPFNRDL